MIEEGYGTPDSIEVSSSLVVRDWHSKVSDADNEAYKQLQEQIDRLNVEAGTMKIDQLKIAARAVRQAQIHQKRIIYKYDFRLFVDECFPNLQDKVTTPDFHTEIYNAFQQNMRVAVVCPRGFGKSSLARIYLLHQILNGLVRYVVLLGSSETMAGQNLLWIREQLVDNDKILETYGDISSKEKWTDTEFETSTKICVLAKGAGQKIRGLNKRGRPDLVYIDDLEDKENVSNKENRATLADWFTKAVLPIVSKNGRFIFTGTILDVDSLLKNITMNKYRDHLPWKVLFYQAITLSEDGTERSLWEDMKPLEVLREIRRNSPESFAQEYQNQPTYGSMQVFDRTWYGACRYDSKSIQKTSTGVFVNGKKVNLMLTTDFAISEKQGADFTVMLVSGMDKTGHLWLIDKLRWKTADTLEMITEMFNLVKKWGIDFVSIETVAFQQAMSRQIQREQETHKLFFYVHELKRSGTTKLARIKALASPMKQGKLHWPADWEDLEDEFNQTTAAKTGKHDDILDTCSDGFELQNEELEEDKEEQVPINTIEWLVRTGQLTPCEVDYEMGFAN